MPRRCRPAALLAAALCSVTLATLARASEAPSTAQALFDEARGIMAAGRYAEACPLFAESQRLDPGGGTLLNLALCHEAEGKTATAWAELKEALGVARQDARADRAELAAARIAAIEPRLSRLSVIVPPEARLGDLVVARDGVALGAAVWGRAVPVDPGSHVVSAKAPGRKPWQTSVQVDADADSQTVTVPPLAPAGASEDAGAGPGTGWGAGRIAGLVAGAAGLVCLGIGTGFGIDAISKAGQSDDLCDKEVCPNDAAGTKAVDLNDQAAVSAKVSDGLFVAGGALVAAGVVLLLATGDGGTEGAPAQVAAVVGPGRAGLAVIARW
ncbi:MAG: tetratricopeptide repeat protein [Deltaproteobacteria bacterium]|nr:tetratricopeptide repeat protein [Deltaproteobacteria bacterium]